VTPSRPRFARRVAVVLGAAGLALAVAELVVRTNRERLGVRSSALWELRGAVCHGRSRFLPTAYVGWVFDPARPGVDSSGFLGADCPLGRRPLVPRIACLGGSTTAGSFYEGYAGSYPGSLAAVLSARLGREVEVLNFGMPGWSTAESLVNWLLHAQDYRPDVVVIHHAVNDVFPRLAPGFRADYRHYRHPWEQPHHSWAHRFLTRWSDLYAVLQLRGGELELSDHVSIPVQELGSELAPGTAQAFRRNLESLLSNVRRGGAIPVLLTMPWNPSRRTTAFDGLLVAGMEEHNEIARALAEREGCELLDLATSADPVLRAEFVDLVHHSVAGYRRKAELLAEHLLERGLVR
jgi:lysophospholipase L1-like esterase